jgi:hypothetical protein
VSFDLLAETLYCAPLERETLVGPEVYKHLAPLEPEEYLVAAFARCASVVATLTKYSIPRHIEPKEKTSN